MWSFLYKTKAVWYKVSGDGEEFRNNQENSINIPLSIILLAMELIIATEITICTAVRYHKSNVVLVSKFIFFTFLFLLSTAIDFLQLIQQIQLSFLSCLIYSISCTFSLYSYHTVELNRLFKGCEFDLPQTNFCSDVDSWWEL